MSQRDPHKSTPVLEPAGAPHHAAIAPFQSVRSWTNCLLTASGIRGRLARATARFYGGHYYFGSVETALSFVPACLPDKGRNRPAQRSAAESQSDVGSAYGAGRRQSRSAGFSHPEILPRSASVCDRCRRCAAPSITAAPDCLPIARAPVHGGRSADCVCCGRYFQSPSDAYALWAVDARNTAARHAEHCVSSRSGRVSVQSMSPAYRAA